MNKRIYDIFNQIHTEEHLKQKTAFFLYNEIQKSKDIRKISRLKHAYILTAIAFLLVMISGVSYKLYFTPSAYIDVDVNPSVELTINRFGRVIAASPYNSEGDGILKIISIRNTAYTEAVKELLETMEAQGFWDQDGLLSLTVQTISSDSERDMLNALNTTVNSVLQRHHSNMEADIFPVTEEVKNCAHEKNVSPAKYLAIIELQQADPSASFESCKGHGISEIRQIAHKHNKNHHNEDCKETDNSEQDSVPYDYETEENDSCHHRYHFKQ